MFGGGSGAPSKQASLLAGQAGAYAKAMVAVYSRLTAGLAAGSQGAQQHQQVAASPRDLTSWVHGLKRCVVGAACCCCGWQLLPPAAVLHATATSAAGMLLPRLHHRYDMAVVDLVEAFAAEGLATFQGRLPGAAAQRQLGEVLLAALRSSLGYRGAPAAHARVHAACEHRAHLTAAAACPAAMQAACRAGCSAAWRRRSRRAWQLQPLAAPCRWLATATRRRETWLPACSRRTAERSQTQSC